MTLILCAKKMHKESDNFNCFSNKNSKKIKNIMKVLDLDDFGVKNDIIIKKYKTNSDIELSNGFIIPIDSFILGWSYHTFGTVNYENEIPIMIPIFNTNDEYDSNYFISICSEKVNRQL